MFPVVQPHYWSVDLVDFLIGDESYATESRPWTDAGTKRVDKLILDTGTTYFTAPPSVCDQILEKIPGGNCEKTKSYPNLTYKLIDEDDVPYDLVVPPSVYMVTDDGVYCEPAFMAIDVPGRYGPAFLLGEVFMRHWHTTFDRGDGSEGSAFVGFAPAKHDPQAMSELEQTRRKYL